MWSKKSKDTDASQNGKKAPRKFPLRMPPNWEPPFPSYASAFDEKTNGVAMAVVGIQFKPADRSFAFEVVRKIVDLVKTVGHVEHFDLAECKKDSAGLGQIVATCYWLNGEKTEAFFESKEFKAIWAEHSKPGAPYGLFREVFNTPIKRFEAVHSHQDHVVAVANIRKEVTDPIQKHAYWGSMRDRIPDSANDQFLPEGKTTIVEQSANRIVVRPNHNFAIIRSGQDIRNASGTEHDEYYRDINPVLKAGMDFLRDEGAEVDCLDCRFMSLLDDEGNASKHTYGFAYFRSLKDLEDWAEHHPTHKAIFGAFLKFMPSYGHIAKSRFWQEVSVLPSGQLAEYVNCAPNTGLLNGAVSA